MVTEPRHITLQIKATDVGFHWYSTDETGAMVLWNAQSFPSRPMAQQDAIAFHDAYNRRPTRYAYQGVEN